MLWVLLMDAVVVGWGGSVYRHSPRAHQLASASPYSCPASPTLERRSPKPTRTSHSPEAPPVANAVATRPSPPPREQPPGRQRRRARKSVDARPETGAEEAS